MTLILDKYLKENAITAKALSEKLSNNGYSLTVVSISNILTGKSSPKVSTLEEIADSLDVHISCFFDGNSTTEDLTTGEILNQIKELTEEAIKRNDKPTEK